MKAAAASNAITSLAGRPSTLPPCPSPWLASAGCGVSGGARRISRASGATASATIDREHQHGLPPAEQRDAALEHRRPDGAGDILAAGDQRQRGAAAAIEPAADIDVARCVDAAVAEQADEQPVADPQPPGAVAGGDHEADADHQSAECHGPLHADPVGDASHGDAAECRAEPGQRVGQRRNRPRAAKFAGDLLQRDHRHERRAIGDRHDAQCGEGNDPGGPRLDTGHHGVLASAPITGKAPQCSIAPPATRACPPATSPITCIRSPTRGGWRARARSSSPAATASASLTRRGATISTRWPGCGAPAWASARSGWRKRRTSRCWNCRMRPRSASVRIPR